VILEILPGARDGERYELNLDRAGIANLAAENQNHSELNDNWPMTDTQFVEDSELVKYLSVVGRHPGVRLFQ